MKLYECNLQNFKKVERGGMSAPDASELQRASKM